MFKCIYHKQHGIQDKQQHGCQNTLLPVVFNSYSTASLVERSPWTYVFVSSRVVNAVMYARTWGVDVAAAEWSIVFDELAVFYVPVEGERNDPIDTFQF